ncbi:STY0301 family protein [Endosaccharibacter trunci]
MWWNRLAAPSVVLIAMSCAAAGPAACPPDIFTKDGKHRLVNASLFDGPPSHMTDLIPAPAGVVDRWDIDRIDPYLVCRFAGTAQTVTIHEKGAKVCEVGDKPFRAGCR